MKLVTARIVGEPIEGLDPQVQSKLATLAKALYDTQLNSLGDFLRAMGVSVQQVPAVTRLYRTLERSDTDMQTRHWFVAECKSSNLDCTVKVAFLYNPQSTEIDAVKYSLDAGEDVPAFHMIPQGQERWLYSEVVVKRFGAANAAELLPTLGKALERVIRADMKSFRARIEETLAASKNAILQLIRVGEYKA